MTAGPDLFDVSRFIEAEEGRKGRRESRQTVASDFRAQAAVIPVETPPEPQTVASPATLQECRDGVAQLTRLPGPTYRDRAWWQRLVSDAQSFDRVWLEQAISLGWSTRQMFGCNRQPWAGRLDLNGLVVTLAGRPIRDIMVDRAVIPQRSGQATAFYIHMPGMSVPFDFSASVPLWEAFSA